MYGNDALSLVVLSHVVLVLCGDWPHVTMVTSPLRIQCLEIEVDHVTQFLTFCVQTSESSMCFESLDIKSSFVQVYQSFKSIYVHSKSPHSI